MNRLTVSLICLVLGFATQAKAEFSRADLDKLISRIQSQHNDQFSKKYGASLTFKVFEGGRPVIDARNIFDKIVLTSGMTKIPNFTLDAAAVVLCHEVGHSLGGFPRVQRAGLEFTIEGQSDYFATTKCTKKLWNNENNVAVVSKLKVDPLVLQRCSKVYPDKNKRALCIRASMAAYNMMMALSNGSKFSFATPDRSLSDGFYSFAYPSNQCRLDTLFAGALCDKGDANAFDDRIGRKGACSRADQPLGARPACWYRE